MALIIVDGQPVFICRVQPQPTCWTCRKLGRKRVSVARCDGPPPPASRKKTCDAPMCAEHRTRVGEDLDHCPRCVGRPIVPAVAPHRAKAAAQPTLFELQS